MGRGGGDHIKNAKSGEFDEKWRIRQKWRIRDTVRDKTVWQMEIRSRDATRAGLTRGHVCRVRRNDRTYNVPVLPNKQRGHAHRTPARVSLPSAPGALSLTRPQHQQQHIPRTHTAFATPTLRLCLSPPCAVHWTRQSPSLAIARMCASLSAWDYATWTQMLPSLTKLREQPSNTLKRTCGGVGGGGCVTPCNHLSHTHAMTTPNLPANQASRRPL